MLRASKFIQGHMLYILALFVPNLKLQNTLISNKIHLHAAQINLAMFLKLF